MGYIIKSLPFAMRVLGISILINILFLLISPKLAQANWSILSNEQFKTGEIVDFRVPKLKTFLRNQDSILADFSEIFIKIADKYGLRYSLLPAICGRESTFAKNYPQKSYNCFGWGPSIYFQSWEESIEKVSKGIKENYVQKWGRDTVDEIASIYAASPAWASGIKQFISEIENTAIPEYHSLEPNL